MLPKEVPEVPAWTRRRINLFAVVGVISAAVGVVLYTGWGNTGVQAAHAAVSSATRLWGDKDVLVMSKNQKRTFDGSCIDVYHIVSLCFQKDGNLVLYQLAGADKRYTLWASGTDGHSDGASLEFQDDGNLVIYSAGHEGQWRSGTTDGETLVLQADCNLVIYSPGHVDSRWSSNTACDKNHMWPVDEVEIMKPGDVLKPGNCSGLLGVVSVCFQEDGNLVIYKDAFPGEGRCAAWRSGERDGAAEVVFQDDGNLVMYNGEQPRKTLWALGKDGQGGNSLVLQADCNLVLYKHGDGSRTAITSTGSTCPKCDGILGETKIMTRGTKIEKPKQGDSRCWDVEKRSSFCFQDDGNLVIYQLNPAGERCPQSVWTSGTAGHSDGAELEFQDNGDLVLYSPGHEGQWHTKTDGQSGQELVLSGDCNMVLYGPDRTVAYETNTHCGVDECVERSACKVIKQVCALTFGGGGATGVVGCAAQCTKLGAYFAADIVISTTQPWFIPAVVLACSTTCGSIVTSGIIFGAAECTKTVGNVVPGGCKIN